MYDSEDLNATFGGFDQLSEITSCQDDDAQGAKNHLEESSLCMIKKKRDKKALEKESKKPPNQSYMVDYSKYFTGNPENVSKALYKKNQFAINSIADTYDEEYMVKYY